MKLTVRPLTPDLWPQLEELSGLYTSTATTFARAGFKTVALPAPHRPTMRLALKRAAR